MANAPFSMNLGISGLGETDIIVPNTDTYVVQVRLGLPTQDSVISSCVTVVKVNSTTSYTSNAGDRGLTYAVACNSGDTIKVILSSAAAIDNAANAIKGNISISQGNI